MLLLEAYNWLLDRCAWYWILSLSNPFSIDVAIDASTDAAIDVAIDVAIDAATDAAIDAATALAHEVIVNREVATGLLRTYRGGDTPAADLSLLQLER